MKDAAALGRRIHSIEEFQCLPDEEGRMELVRGRVVREPPPGAEHGHVGLKLLLAMARHVEEHDLGLVVSLETGFVLEETPPTVRAPDVAFIRGEHVSSRRIPSGYWRFPPDLAVEVVSPSDRAGAVEEKALDYLRCGVEEVWIVQPRTRSVTVYRSPSDIRSLSADDVLDGGTLLPELRVPVGDLFG